MARSISEFIQEQDTGYEFSSNDNYVKAYCEYAMANSLVNCYAEQLHIASFAEEYDITLIQEENVFKKIGHGISELWKKFIGWIKSILNSIRKKRDEKAIAEATEILGAISDDAKVPVAKVEPFMTYGIFMDYAVGDNSALDEAVDTLKQILDSNESYDDNSSLNDFIQTTEKLKKLGSNFTYKDLVKAVEDRDAGDFGATSTVVDGRFVKSYVKFINAKETNKKIDETNKKIDELKKRVEVNGSITLTDLNDKSSPSAEEIKKKDAALQNNQKIVKVFTDFMAAFTAVYQTIETKATKAAPGIKRDLTKASAEKNSDYDVKQESFYFV